MATRKASPKVATVNALDVLFDASFSQAKGDAALRDAFIAAGGDHDEPKRTLMSGRVAFSLQVSREAALIILGKKGRGKNSDDANLGDDVRTVAEEKAYGAARVFLSGRLKAWGIKTTEQRGGDRNARDAVTMDTEKLKVPGKPKIETSDELGAYALAYAKSGYDLFLLNKEHSAVKTDMGSELMGAFSDFVAEIASIVAAHKPA